VATDYYSRKKVHIIFFKKRFANADSMPIKLVYPVHCDHPPVACWTASMMGSNSLVLAQYTRRKT
jgi:hypothetical protein